MKVAVCLSGQLRKWRMGKENQKWFWTTFNFEDVEVDYFIHTWNYSWDRPGVSHPYQERRVSKEEFKELTDFYQPKKAIFDDKRQPYFYGNDHWSSLFYSLSQSLVLKREYEIENNFEYDIVVKSRPDVVFDPSQHARINYQAQIQDGVIFTTHGGKMELEFNMFNFNDCVFYSNSYTMDLLVNLYFYRQFLINENTNTDYNVHPLGPGTLMHEFFREYGIVPFFNTGWQEVLLKEGCPEVDLFDREEFSKVADYFYDWYKK